MKALILTAALMVPWPDEAAPQPRVDADGQPLPPGAVARLGTLRLRQGGWVLAASLSFGGSHAPPARS